MRVNGASRHALRRRPVEEFRRRARIGGARVRVPDLRGEEFEEAIGSTGAGRGDKRGCVCGGDGRELVHGDDFSAASRASMIRKRWFASMMISAASSASL